MHRTVRLFGRALPLGIVVAGLAIMVVGAWALLALLLHSTATGVATSQAPAPDMTIGDPTCTRIAGTGTIASCTRTASGGVALQVTDISSNTSDGNPTIIRADASVHNNGSAAVCSSLVWLPVSGVAITSTGDDSIAPGGDGWMRLRFDFGTITPSQHVDAGDVVVSWVTCP